MPIDALFQPLNQAGAPVPPAVTLAVDGKTRTVPMASSVAAALLAAGVVRFRQSPVSGGDRGPYCMMGVCFECLLEIDGVPNRQACLVPVRAGMAIRTQGGSGDRLDDLACSAPAGARSLELPHGA